MIHELSGPRKASYLLFLLSVLVVARFDLGPFALSGLVSFMIMDLAERRLHALGAKPILARWAAMAVFAILATLLGWIFIKFLRLGLARLPVLLDTVLPRFSGLLEAYGMDFPADNAQELRDFVMSSAGKNAASLRKTSGLLTRDVFQVVAGIFAAALRFLTPADHENRGDLFDALRLEFNARVVLFTRGFERVVGAQVAISTINALLTAVFLHALGFPFRTFLTLATFVCGMIPIAGNVISNALIVAAGLTVSTHLALMGLVYLVVIHKLEYLLNSRIVGGSIGTPMWMTLVGLVAGEAVMGISGVLLAPALIHYARAELRAVPARK